MNAYIYQSRLGLALALGTICVLTPTTGRAGLLPVAFKPGAPIISDSNGALNYSVLSASVQNVGTPPSR
jgi:hypothetical protein